MSSGGRIGAVDRREWRESGDEVPDFGLLFVFAFLGL